MGFAMAVCSGHWTTAAAATDCVMRVHRFRIYTTPRQPRGCDLIVDVAVVAGRPAACVLIPLNRAIAIIFRRGEVYVLRM